MSETPLPRFNFPLPFNELTLQEALNQFTEWAGSKYAPRTILVYTLHIKNFISFTGDKSIGTVEITEIVRYYASLKKRFQRESSIAYTMIALRQFFKFLFLRRLIEWDWQLISVPKYVSKSYIPVEAEVAHKMIESVSENTFRGLRDKTILSFLFASGLRVSELCDLLLSDLYLEKKYGNIISKKNRQKRMVFWDEGTDRLFMKYLPAREQFATSDYLFISLNRGGVGGRLSTRSVERLVAYYRSSGGITPHSFRHGLGMRAVASGVHPRYIQKILGHKNLNSSQIYLDTRDEDVIAAYKKLSTEKDLTHWSGSGIL